MKVDMTKAYDMEEWDTLFAIMESHGFDRKFRNVVYNSISTVHFPILVNGTPYDFFQGSRGIRQWDSISSTLRYVGGSSLLNLGSW